MEPGLQGPRGSALNDVREVISFAMKMNGYPLNSVDKNHLAVCMKDLKALAPNILAYDTDTIKQKFIAEEAWIGTMWSGDAYFSNKENSNIGFIVPKEGTGIWADCFAIPKGAKNKELVRTTPRSSKTIRSCRRLVTTSVTPNGRMTLATPLSCMTVAGRN